MTCKGKTNLTCVFKIHKLQMILLMKLSLDQKSLINLEREAEHLIESTGKNLEAADAGWMEKN